MGTIMTETLWRYKQLLAGQIYQIIIFTTKQAAVQFASQMDRVEPDMFSKIDEIDAKKVWD